MGSLVKLIDSSLFVYFLAIVLSVTLLDCQIILPQHLFPTFLVDLKTWFVREYEDYLIGEKPNFFVGLVWVEHLFQYPLALACLYGIAAGKSWFNTTCLLCGLSISISMVAILSELILSERAPVRLLALYFFFFAFSILATFRGLASHSGKSMAIGKKPVLNGKKEA